MASEILSLLQSIGIILTVSDAIIGLTVFAIGNSLPDLVANISVARNGYTDMAIAACFGGPMLNMLIGIGVSSTYYNLHTGPCYISFTPTLISSAVGLFCGLLISGIYVPCNEWKGTRHYGLVLIGIYVVLMVVNIMLELFSGKR
jgi:sodium/potassium/calcium exchanger 6